MSRRKPSVAAALHVGFLSSDFKQHPVSTLFAPALEALRRRAPARLRLSVFALNDVAADARGAPWWRRLAAAAHASHDLHSLDDAAAAAALGRARIDLLVDPSTFTIIAVENEMMVRPYSNCEMILPNYQALVGLSITRGYSKQVKKLFGGPNGCSHMGALLQAMGPVAIQASWSLVNLHKPLESRLNNSDDPEDIDRRLRLNMNSCHVWHEDGEHIELVKVGKWVLPDWESDRLMDLGVKIPDEQGH